MLIAYPPQTPNGGMLCLLHCWTSAYRNGQNAGCFWNRTPKTRETGFITNSGQIGDGAGWGTQTVPDPWLQPDFLPPLTSVEYLPLVGMKAFLSLLVFVQIEPGIIDIFLEIAQYSFICFNTGMCFIWEDSLWEFFCCFVFNFCISSHPPILDE